MKQPKEYERMKQPKETKDKSPSFFDKELEKCWKRFWDINLYTINDFKKDIKSIVERDYVTKQEHLILLEKRLLENGICRNNHIEKQKALDIIKKVEFFYDYPEIFDDLKKELMKE